MLLLASFLSFLSLSYASSTERLTFHDDLVLRCFPETTEHLEFLHDMSENDKMNLDFWLEPKRIGGPVDIMMNSKQQELMMKMMDVIGVSCKVLIPSVQELVDGERVRSTKNVNVTTPFFLDYHPWQEVQEYITDLATKEFPNMATTFTVGTTYEGRPMEAIRLSTAPNTGKPILWFDGGLHAREWVTVSTVTYIADTLLRQYGTNDDITFMLDTFDVIVLPVANVDGYDYTWNTDRMWRKTRSPNARSSCMGTDPNRNWAFHWAEAGASPLACSDSYQGPSAASEVEVQAMQSYLCGLGEDLKGYINFHSYSQLWMSPWGYTDELPPDYTQQNDLSKAAVTAIKNTHGMVYDYGTISNIIYPASGSSADYVYGVCGVKYSYGAELRDTGEYGFLLPPDQIIPTGEEILASVIAMAKFIDANP